MKFKDDRMRHRRRGRHQNDLGLAAVKPRSVFWLLAEHTFWIKHDEPFAKRRAGYDRRKQRKFVVQMDRYIPDAPEKILDNVSGVAPTAWPSSFPPASFSPAIRRLVQ